VASIRPLSDAANRRWSLELPAVEAAVLLSLPDRLEAVLADPDGNRRIVDRLFPASYSDADEERENRRLLGGSLLDARREMLADVRGALAGGRRRRRGLVLELAPGGIDLLLRFINDIRLLLATDLGIEQNLGELTIDPGHPEAPKYTLLVYLGGLEGLLVDAVNAD
jgi:hypothetical protein